MQCRAALFVVLGIVLSGSSEARGTDPARVRFVWADFDGDGLQDVYVLRPEGGDSLFRNAGDGSFEDATVLALPCVSCAASDATWCDVDLDRRPDLLRVLVSGSVELLRNRGDGAFEDVTSVAGLDRVVGTSAARWFDYDADGRADLELETEGAPVLFHNLGDLVFEAVPLADLDATRALDGSAHVRAIPGALDGQLDGLLDADTRGANESRRAGATAAAIAGSLVDEVHPDPLVLGGPSVDPLEPNPDATVSFSFGNRCAMSVKDTATGDCVLVSTLPALGKLYPLSATLFVSTDSQVGIGTTTPAAKLEVAGTARMTDTLTLAPSGDEALDISTGSLYKAGLPFAHTKGGAANTAIGLEALAGVTTGSSNTASGFRALFSDSTGINNTATGVRALYANTTGNRNTASGYRALTSNTSGTNNTASGVAALRYNTTGNVNTAFGESALRSNTTGFANTASGVRALFANTVGDFNTASGYQALTANTSGRRNSAFGVRALESNTTGSYNTATGYEALRDNTTGEGNTASGYLALSNNSTGSQNTATGRHALFINTTGSRNTATGHEALRYNVDGTFNTANGDRALTSNLFGDHNTAAGYAALRYNTTGNRNTAHGDGALRQNTTGGDNTAVGRYALRGNTTATRNTAVGISALELNITGFQNTAVGYSSLRFNSGSRNTACGGQAFVDLSTGNDNIGLGHGAGSGLLSGSNNIMIGSPGVGGDGATIRVGIAGTHTRAFLAGVRGATTGVADAIPVVVDSAGQLGTVSSSRRFKEDIADMGDASERLLELRPVVFRYKPDVQQGERPLEYGLIAEEVAEVFPDLVVYDDEGLPFTVKYHLLSSMLLNELQGQDERLARLEEAHAGELAEVRKEFAAQLAALESEKHGSERPAASGL